MGSITNLLVIASANGKCFASGTLTPASQDVDVITGLSAVDHCGVSLEGAPVSGHAFSSAVPGSTDGEINILSFELDVTVSTAEVAVTWWAIGDR